MWNDIIQRYLVDMDTISELEVNNPHSVYARNKGKRVKLDVDFRTDEQYMESTKQLAKIINPAFNMQSNNFEYLEEGRLRLPNGNTARVHIVLPPASDYPLITIAKKTTNLTTLDDIYNSGSMSMKMRNFIKACIDIKQTMVLSGSTGSGKALHKDTLVKTKNKGYIPIIDISINDVIYDENYKEYNVLKKFNPEIKKAYMLYFDNGEKVKACENHLWKVVKNGADIIVNTNELFNTYKQVKIIRNNSEEILVLNIEEISIADNNKNDYYCLQVDGPSKTFLITKKDIPTHNTTFVEAVSKLIPMDTRIGVVEDSPELALIQPNVVYLHTKPWRPGMDPNDEVTLDWCTRQINRMRTDLLIIGETRGKEFHQFLLGANSGMEGSMTTLHANSPKAALSKMTQFCMEAQPSPIRVINKMISTTVDIIVQLTKTVNGEYKCASICEVSRILGNDEDATIATSMLSEYDEKTKTWNDKFMISDQLRKKLISYGYDCSTFLKNENQSTRTIPSFSFR